MNEEIRIMVVDDHDTFRDPLAFMLEREPDLTVVARPRSLSEAREVLESAELAVDVAIVDLNLPDGSGTDLIKDLRGSRPRAKALVLSAISEQRCLAAAIEAGAAGVLHKSTPMGDLAEGVRRLAAGEQLLSQQEVIEALQLGGAGPNRLVGTAENDTLRGRVGADELIGKGDSDRLFGGSGNDLINAREVGEAEHDRVDCGAGRDTVLIDNTTEDTILANCEVVRRGYGLGAPRHPWPTGPGLPQLIPRPITTSLSSFVWSVIQGNCCGAKFEFGCVSAERRKKMRRL